MKQTKRKKLSDLFRHPELICILFMGIACGFPLALTASTLKTWLSEHSISMREIGAFAFVAIPYSIKFLWSPFIDGIKLPFLQKKMGQRRSWLLVVQILLSVAVFALANIKPENSLLICAGIATVVAFLSATQDIIVDAYRIERLSDDIQPMGVTMYIYGYRIGLYMAGAILLVIADYSNWNYAYYAAAVIMAMSIIVTLICSEPKHLREKAVNKILSYTEHLHSIVIKPFLNLITMKDWQYLLLFIVLFKLGDALAGNLTNPFLIKTGFTKTEIALIVKTYGLPATLFGTFLGGVIAHRFGLIKSLLFAGIIQMLSNVMFIVQDQVGHNNAMLTATILIENISGSIGDVVFVGYISSMCNKKFAATQYALFSSIATTGRNLISGSSGFIVDDYGWSIFFLVSIIAALPGILLIFKIRHIKKPKEI
ncbi:MAG: MFS transporter [Rickettsiales bacterium]